MPIPSKLVRLEEHQTAKIIPIIQKLLDDKAVGGGKGLVFAQVFYDEMRVFYLPNEIADPVHKLISDYFADKYKSTTEESRP